MAVDSFRALISGAAGALVLTALHETARQRMPHAPRMDLLGMRALRRFVPGLQHERPRSLRLRRLALAGDLIANAVYYSGVAARSPAETYARAATMGLAAGTGALLLPEPLGLGEPPDSGHRANQVMTVAWYVAGALAAAVAANSLRYGRLPR
jgi:hypothetical protein